MRLCVHTCGRARVCVYACTCIHVYIDVAKYILEFITFILFVIIQKINKIINLNTPKYEALLTEWRDVIILCQNLQSSDLLFF